MLMNALNKVARGERMTMIIALVAAVALVLGVGGFFMARTFLTSADSGTTASKSSSDSNGGMSGDSSPSEASQVPDTAPQSEAAPTPEATASSMPPCEDGTSAPDGTCLHPASVQWLDDLLPDPSTVDRKDADAVCSAYVITNQTWDASRDVTDAFASIRASVYETPELQRNHTPTPELVKGQGEFLPLVPNRSHTTVTIENIGVEGRESTRREGNEWVRLVSFTRSYADDSHEPVRELVFLTLVEQEDGTWAVGNAEWH
ncbi:hypothetical protein HMPREF1980_00587 [Actinomyces sp. oral taxon 172 str. F0311]|nr:hypothetical protein HMPREF1980_00587 [Actinomyces sp. oral taxon 172 str. F0311]